MVNDSAYSPRPATHGSRPCAAGTTRARTASPSSLQPGVSTRPGQCAPRAAGPGPRLPRPCSQVLVHDPGRQGRDRVSLVAAGHQRYTSERRHEALIMIILGIDND